MKTYLWQLQIMKHMKWLRKVLPGWHVAEKAFRDWYIALLQNFRFANHEEYMRYVQALRAPEDVRGYREVRYPKMEEARRRVQSLLNFPSEHGAAVSVLEQNLESLTEKKTTND
ncbi:MAG: hypothetical protein HY582_00970 [Candidatus Omnitrophica bacterium]|nr:hypothetical protein [Candidatus Omnitrophota bacterium]